jgi:hypothetical protein
MARTREYQWDGLAKLRDAGFGTHRIAKIYGCEPSTVRSALMRLGLPTKLPKVPAPNIEAEIERFRRHGVK